MSRFYHKAENSHSQILLSDYGCGIVAVLIVKGAAYGQVLMDQRESDWGGLYPTSPEDDLTPAVKPLTFLEWYETWLDKLIKEKSM